VTGASAPPARLRVLTWNIRAAIGPGEPFPLAWWRHVRADRRERIAALIRAFDADVVTLQEVTIKTVNGAVDDQPAELGRLTGMHVRYAAVHSFPLIEPETGAAIGSAMWGNAILTRGALADGFALALPRAADHDLVEPARADHPLAGARYGHVEPGHREARCAVGGRLGAVTMATAHLTYIGREQRRSQVDVLAGLVSGTEGPAILTGDFNAPVEAAEMVSLRGVVDDAFAAVGVPAGDVRRQSCGQQAIDHIYVRGCAVEGCRVADETGDASDHWPVVADLVVR
jgi:endonuclease/exonuclease/phosphatase family metal-dependent hydrolase